MESSTSKTYNATAVLDHCDSRLCLYHQSSVRAQCSYGNHVSDYDSIFAPGGGSFGIREASVSNAHSNEHEAHEPYSHNQCDKIMKHRPNRSYWWNDQFVPKTNLEINILMRTHDILKGKHCPQKTTLIYILQSHLITLMLDTKLLPIFQALLDACEREHLDSLVGMVLLERESFINAACCREGVRSMAKLIRKLKKSQHAITLTRILSTKFLEIMTDHTARQVIQTCFIHFGHEPNEILYERTIIHCHFLAIHKVGCRSLNNCISTIAGQQQSRLLDSIAGIADILCDDPYGNYVLQNVLELNHTDVNTKIFNSLSGQFIVLAQRKVGSHTVEKCMEISQIWLLSVVEEILNRPQTPQLLAQHHFGNYVVQKALRMTMEHGLIDLYDSLVASLRPHFSALTQTTGGRSVIGVINEHE